MASSSDANVIDQFMETESSSSEESGGSSHAWKSEGLSWHPSRREMVSRLYAIHQSFAGDTDEETVRELASGLGIGEDDLATMISNRKITTASLKGFFEKLLCKGDQFLTLASDSTLSESRTGFKVEKVDWDLIPSHITRVPGMSYYEEVVVGSWWESRYRTYYVGFKPDKRYSILVGGDSEYEEVYTEEIDLTSHTFLTQLLNRSPKGELLSLGCDLVQYSDHQKPHVDREGIPHVGYISPEQVLYHYPKELFCHMIMNSNISCITRWFHETFYHYYGYSPRVQNWVMPSSDRITDWTTIFPVGSPPDCAISSIAPLLLEKIVYTLRTLRIEKHPRCRTNPPYERDPIQGWFGIDPEIDAFLVTPVFATRILDSYTEKPSLNEMYKFRTVYRLRAPDGGVPGKNLGEVGTHLNRSYLNRRYIGTFLKRVLEKGSCEEYQAYLDTYHELVKLEPSLRFGLDFGDIYKILAKRSVANPLREEFLPIYQLVVDSMMEIGVGEDLIQYLRELV